MTIQQQNQGQQSRVFHDLSALVLNLLGVPPTATALFFSDQSPGSERRRYPRTITPAGFGWLMLGISVSMMFCGSITFFIGLMLMPWVVGLAIVLYVAGIVSTVSALGRSILCYAIAPLLPPKDIPDVDSNGDEEDSDKPKEDDSMDENRNPTGLHVPKPLFSYPSTETTVPDLAPQTAPPLSPPAPYPPWFMRKRRREKQQFFQRKMSEFEMVAVLWRRDNIMDRPSLSSD